MASARALGLGAAGLALAYAGSNCIFNVESGHRGIVFNRLGGIKDTVRFSTLLTIVLVSAELVRLQSVHGCVWPHAPDRHALPSVQQQFTIINGEL